jgi:hypothetical protein
MASYARRRPEWFSGKMEPRREGISTFNTALDIFVSRAEVLDKGSSLAGVLSAVIAMAAEADQRCFLDLGALFANAALDVFRILGACAC